MSCPDWKGVTAWRDDRAGVEPAGYREALAHFDGGCKACRRQALSADPTLMFRSVPVIEIPEAQEVDEVEAMRQAVAAMRTASRMEALETRRTRQGWWKWASAAMLTVAALSVSSDGRFGADREDLGVGNASLQANFFERADLFEAMPASYPPAAAEPFLEESPRDLQIDAGGVQIKWALDENAEALLDT